MQGRLSIGDFSKMTHLSIKTLRHYHQAGLLEPAAVDPTTNYRYYSPAQIPVAQTIRRFRDLGMPVVEVGDLLSADPASRDELIARHLGRLEKQLADTREAVLALRRLLGADHDDVEVQRRTTSHVVAAGIREEVAMPRVLDWYAEAMTELRGALARAGQTPTGAPGGLYDNSLFTDENGELVVFIPVADPPSVGRVMPLDIPPTDVAVTVHRGSHADIDVTYGALGAWVDRHGLAISGPVHENYLVGPHDTADALAWRTEIGWPVG